MWSRASINRIILALFICAHCSNTGLAQLIVPIEADRGIFSYEVVSTEHDSNFDGFTHTLEPLELNTFGHIAKPYGDYTWSLTHRSTIADSRLLVCGVADFSTSIDPKIVITVWDVSVFQLKFTLTRPTTMRLRCRDYSWHGMPPATGEQVETLVDVWLQAGNTFLFGISHRNEQVSESFDQLLELPAGEYTLYTDAEVAGFDFNPTENYSGHAEYRVSLVNVNCASDITGDGVVDVSDLSEALSSLGPNSKCSPADLDLDGDVDLDDLNALIADYGMSCGG